MRQLHKLRPGDISTFSGEVVNTDHVEEVSGQTMSGSGSTWTDVHRELWIRPLHGAERRFTFTNVAVPARKGHRVTLLIGAGRPLAIINFSTEQYLNLVTPRHFGLFNAAEPFVFAALLVLAGLAGLAALTALAVAASAYSLVKCSIRRQRYSEAATLIEMEIQRIVSYPPTH
jgi:hypothetical protein